MAAISFPAVENTLENVHLDIGQIGYSLDHDHHVLPRDKDLQDFHYH